MSVKDLEQKIDQLRANAASIQKTLRQRRDDIDADPSLSPQGKQTQKETLIDAARAQITQLRDQEKKLVSDRIDQINRSLGGYAGTDPAAIIAFRDAYDRAEAIDDKAKALEVLERARTMGDKVLAAAIMRRALPNNIIGSGWPSVVDRYTEVYPEAREQVEDLRALQEFLDNGFGRTLTYAVLS